MTTTGTHRKPVRYKIADAGDAIRRRETFTAGDGSLTGGQLGRLPVHAPRLPADALATFDAAASAGPLYVVASYGTPIAWAGPGESLTVPAVQYSVTTSRHQGIARRVRAEEAEAAHRAHTPSRSCGYCVSDSLIAGTLADLPS